MALQLILILLELQNADLSYDLELTLFPDYSQLMYVWTPGLSLNLCACPHSMQAFTVHLQP